MPNCNPDDQPFDYAQLGYGTIAPVVVVRDYHITLADAGVTQNVWNPWVPQIPNSLWLHVETMYDLVAAELGLCRFDDAGIENPLVYQRIRQVIAECSATAMLMKHHGNVWRQGTGVFRFKAENYGTRRVEKLPFSVATWDALLRLAYGESLTPDQEASVPDDIETVNALREAFSSHEWGRIHATQSPT